ncbi:methyltransferase domain-containing protein [Zoogloea sp.]|uniref:methyltransferase domain-containing protein n=1 Tax=Zoogloea sp. TaxID=49181 RepID=UPI0035B43233
MAWEPDRYLQFADERQRPALDLLRHIPDGPTPCRQVVDLGCGPGNLTGLLAQRWPEAQICGIDSSAAMLARAQSQHPDKLWLQADIARWAPAPDERPDLIFSNAALHWVDDHAELFPRLLAQLAPGGTLAVQMPGNFDAPSHRLIRELAAEAPWAERMGQARMGAILPMADYHRILAPHARRLQLWETIYWQTLSGEQPVLDWLRGTTLLPYLATQDEAGKAAFCAALAPRLDAAYPQRPDGHGQNCCLFPFRRVFLIAQR